jgi:hypothetical protein
MSFLRRAKEVTGDLAAASKRQAQRGKLELEIRQLEGKVNSEKDAIGHAVFPLLEAGTVVVDLPEVRSHLASITALLDTIAQRKAEIEMLKRDTQEDAVSASMADTDRNATAQAAADQSAADALADRNDSPAEQGGQG